MTSRAAGFQVGTTPEVQGRRRGLWREELKRRGRVSGGKDAEGTVAGRGGAASGRGEERSGCVSRGPWRPPLRRETGTGSFFPQRSRAHPVLRATARCGCALCESLTQLLCRRGLRGRASRGALGETVRIRSRGWRCNRGRISTGRKLALKQISARRKSADRTRFRCRVDAQPLETREAHASSSRGSDSPPLGTSPSSSQF